MSTSSFDKAILKRQMIRSSTCSVILADHSKFEKQYFVRICSVEDVDILITDKNFSKKEEEEIKTKVKILSLEGEEDK